MGNFEQVHQKLLKSKAFAKEWAKPDVMEIGLLRRQKGLTQKQLAKKIGTQQSAISRLENNCEKATLDFVGRIAYALGLKARIVFSPLKDK